MIEFVDVSRDWGEFKLKNVSFKVDKGDFFVILGPTGAGKTLILETIAGFYSPDSGKIFLRGEDSGEELPEHRRIGFVYQDYALFPHMTVEENIRFGLEMKKIPVDETKEMVDSSVNLLDIRDLMNRYPKTLSGGEQQRVAIARALVIEPDILLLDEPLSALDANTRTSIRQELKRIHEVKRITTIYVTHDQNEALLLADKIAIIMNGEVAQFGPSEEVFNSPNSLTVAQFLGVENISKGKVMNYSEGVAFVQIDDYLVKVASEVEKGEVFVFIKPEDIILSEEPLESSARNVLKSRITEVINMGKLYEVKVDLGLRSIITKQSVEKMCLVEGKTIYLNFKASAVHIIQC